MNEWIPCQRQAVADWFAQYHTPHLMRSASAATYRLLLQWRLFLLDAEIERARQRREQIMQDAAHWRGEQHAMQRYAQRRNRKLYAGQRGLRAAFAPRDELAFCGDHVRALLSGLGIDTLGALLENPRHFYLLALGSRLFFRLEMALHMRGLRLPEC
jgi:hypothetical protein